MIIKDKKICDGKPVIKGRRIGPSDILIALFNAMNGIESDDLGDIIRQYLCVSNEEIIECLEYYLED